MRVLMTVQPGGAFAPCETPGEKKLKNLESSGCFLSPPPELCQRFPLANICRKIETPRRQSSKAFAARWDGAPTRDVQAPAVVDGGSRGQR